MNRFILQTVLAFCFASAAQAQAIDPFNRQPLQGDVVLPMPCNGKMAFRRVGVTVEPRAGDALVQIGSATGQNGYAEFTQRAAVAGAFRDGAQTYFLMAKYELTQWQMNALLGRCAPPPLVQLPAASISWFDAVNLANRYSLWLRANAAKSLPKADGEMAYARLPTEEEWEYAARGGDRVSAAQFGDALFPMPQGVARYAWFNSSQSAAGKVRPAGLLAPNPLGLHDMIGNVDEMMLEPFRLRWVGRSGGQPGGVVVRGGNVFTDQADLRTSLRLEQPMYVEGLPWRSATSGARFVLSAPVLTSTARINQIQQNWAQVGRGAGARPEAAASSAAMASGDPVAALDALIKSAPNPAQRQGFERIRAALLNERARRAEQRDEALRQSLRLGASLCSQLGDAINDYAVIRNAAGASCAGASASPICRRLKEDPLIINQRTLNYLDTLRFVATSYDAANVARQEQVLSQTLQRQGVAQAKLIPFLGAFRGQVTAFQTKQTLQSGPWSQSCAALRKQSR